VCGGLRKGMKGKEDDWKWAVGIDVFSFCEPHKGPSWRLMVRGRRTNDGFVTVTVTVTVGRRGEAARCVEG